MGFYRKSDEHLLFKFDQGRFVVLAIGAVLVAALVFLTGVLVGKSLWEDSPENIASDFNVKKYVTKVDAEKEAVVEKPATAQQYTFYDEINAKGESAKLPSEGEKYGETGMNASTLLPGTTTTGAVEAAQESPDVEKVADPSREEAPQAVEPRPDTVTTVVDKPVAAALQVKKKATPKASAAPPSTRGKYTVQVASFAKPESADAIMKKLVKQGFKANVVSADVKGRTWYRVYVGGFATRTEATEFFERELKPKGMDGFILSK